MLASCVFHSRASEFEVFSCSNECCARLVTEWIPFQPSDKATIATTQQKSGCKFRSLNPQWYKDFKVDSLLYQEKERFLPLLYVLLQ